MKYLHQAATRLCKLLGDDFLQYLPRVLPPLIALAEREPNVTVQPAVGEIEEEEGMRVRQNEIQKKEKTVQGNCTFLIRFFLHNRI